MVLKELNEKLNESWIDISDWGKGNHKDIKSLQQELQNWECSLEVLDWVLTRVVSLVWVDIFHTDKNGVKYNLRETKQVFKNGTEESRNFEHSVGEKMEWNETPITAMRRWLRDVLDLKGFVDIKKWTQNRMSKLSTSYPGLTSQYVRYWFTAKLNNDQFKPEGYIEKQKDKTLYFEWNIVEEVEEEIK